MLTKIHKSQHCCLLLFAIVIYGDLWNKPKEMCAHLVSVENDGDSFGVRKEVLLVMSTFQEVQYRAYSFKKYLKLIRLKSTKCYSEVFLMNKGPVQVYAKVLTINRRIHYCYGFTKLCATQVFHLCEFGHEQLINQIS